MKVQFAIWFAAVSIAGLLTSNQCARAEYPERPITFIVGAGAGGINDTLARLYADHMSKSLGQPIIVDNRPGAGTSIAVMAVTKAAPDGYTVLVNGNTHAVISALYPDVKVDVINSLSSVSLLAVVPAVLAVYKDIPADDLATFVKYLKANPDKLTFGTNGKGSGGHLASELFRHLAGVSFMHVPYRTTPQALNDLLAGRLDMMFDTFPLLKPHIDAGIIKPLATSSLARSSIFPNVPTFDEMGVKGYESSGWTAMYVPKETSQSIIDKLSKAATAAATDPKMIARLADMGIDPPAEMGPAYLDRFLRDEVKKWTDILAAVRAEIRHIGSNLVTSSRLKFQR